MEAPTIFTIRTRVGRRIETLLHLRSNPARASAVGIGLVGVLAVATLCVGGAVTKQSSKAGEAAVESPAQVPHSSENLPVLIYGGYRTESTGEGGRVESDPPESPVMGFGGYKRNAESEAAAKPVMGFGGYGK